MEYVKNDGNYNDKSQLCSTSSQPLSCNSRKGKKSIKHLVICYLKRIPRPRRVPTTGTLHPQVYDTYSADGKTIAAYSLSYFLQSSIVTGTL